MAHRDWTGWLATQSRANRSPPHFRYFAKFATVFADTPMPRSVKHIYQGEVVRAQRRDSATKFARYWPIGMGGRGASSAAASGS
jgi:hypothetical protein